MPLITKADLSTHIYAEILEIITREDDTIITSSIADAEAEAKGYLSRFDLDALFGTDIVVPTIEDSYLKRIIKDITSWHLVTLANPNCSLELFRTRYEDAINWLKMVQAGKTDPDGWPYKEDDEDTSYVEGSNIQASYNHKQKHHF